MRKGLIFYVLSGICALSSITALSSCSSTNVDNSSIETSSSLSTTNPNESKEEEIMADYTDLETFRNDVINGVDVIGKIIHFTPDNGEYRDGFIWHIDYQDMVFISDNCSEVDQGYYMNNNPIYIKVFDVDKPTPIRDKYVVHFHFITKDLIDRGIY